MREPQLSWLAENVLGHPDRLARFLHALPISTIGLDLEGRVTVWNPAAEELFGWTADEVLGEPHPGVPPGFGREWSHVVRRAARQEYTASNVLQSRRDGSTVQVTMHTIPVLDESGGVTGILAVMEDLSPLRGAETSEAALFDWVPVAVWEEDLSEVFPLLEELEAQHGPDLEGWLPSHPAAARTIAARIRMLRANSATMDLLACSSVEEIVARQGHFCTPDTARAFGEALLAVWYDRLPFRSEAVHFLVEGKSRWGRVFVAAGPRTGHPPERVIVAVSDITDLKQSENAARRRDTVLRSLIGATGRLVGRDYLYALVEVLAETLGVEWAHVSRLEGGKVRTLALYGEGRHWPPLEYDVEDIPCANVLRTGSEVCTREPAIRFPQGTVLADRPIVSCAGAALRSEDGVPYGTLCVLGYTPFEDPGLVRTVLEVMADRTAAELARLEAEDALRRREALYEDLIERSRLAIFTDDVEGRLVYVNQRFTELFGWSPEEALGQPSTIIVHPDQQEQLLERHRRRMNGAEEPLAYPIRAVTKAGAELHVEIDVSPVVEGGKLTGTRCYVKDVTDRIELERQYHQAQKLEALGTLAAGIAHDFNNMLQAILVRAEAATLTRGLQDKTLRHFEGIRSAAKKAASLSRQLLAFGRKSDTRREIVDVREVVHNTLAMLGRVIGDEIIISSTQSTEPALVMADPGELEQVVMNLAVNARDAMPDGGTLSLSVRPVELDEGYCSRHPWASPGPWVQLTVGDTGHGMEPETMERIFEPFFTTKERGKGTGLGLATAYGIVSSHGGTIEVQSQPGQGTTFSVYLPAAETGRGPGKVSEDETVRHGLTEGREMILVAEDEPEVREVIGEILQAAGYRVVEAENGDEAVRLFEEHERQLAAALLDLHMPGRGGRDVASFIRTRKAGFPIVFMSGFDPDSASLHESPANGSLFITKPFTGAALLDALSRALGPMRDPVE